jgi:hypothetical protein
LNTAASVNGTLLSFCLAGQLATDTVSSLTAAPGGPAEPGANVGFLLLLFLPRLQVYTSPPLLMRAAGSDRTISTNFDTDNPVEIDAAERLADSTPRAAAAASTPTS